MSKDKWIDAVGSVDEDIVEEFVLRDMEITSKKAKRNRTKRKSWRWIPIVAACLCIAIALSIAAPMQNEELPIEPWIPSNAPWNPVIKESVEEITFDAKTIGEMFEKAQASINGTATNQYTEVYAENLKDLGITAFARTDFLPIYKIPDPNADESALRSFVKKNLASAKSFFGITSSDITFDNGELWTGAAVYSASVEEDERALRFFSRENEMCFYIQSWADEKRLKINDSFISINESDTEDQIEDKLADTFAYVKDHFKKTYSDVKIVRECFSEQLFSITVYLYDTEKSIFPRNFTDAPMCSEYISLEFETDLGYGRTNHWGGSKTEAFLLNVSLYEADKAWSEYYTVIGKSRMLTVDEARVLLEKGYVFGGHSCPLCMAAQPEIDFSNHHAVALEYVHIYEPSGLVIPFYAFYKDIGTNEYHRQVYAKTYVPAIEIEGLEQYFESQQNKHQ